MLNQASLSTKLKPEFAFQVSTMLYDEPNFLSLSKIVRETDFDEGRIMRHMNLLVKNKLAKTKPKTSKYGTQKTWQTTDIGRRVFKSLMTDFNIVRELGGLG